MIKTTTLTTSNSDVPSHCDPLEELKELEESLLEEAVNFEPEHVEINFDYEESSLASSACITEDGEKVELDGDVTITNDGVDSELMRMMKTRCGFSSCPQLMGV